MVESRRAQLASLLLRQHVDPVVAVLVYRDVLLDDWQQGVLLDDWQQGVLLDDWQQGVLLDDWQQGVLLDEPCQDGLVHQDERFQERCFQVDLPWQVHHR